MTDKEIREKVWELFDRHKGLDSRIISHLMSHHSIMAGEGEVTPHALWKEFVAIDHLLDEIRDLVRPDELTQGLKNLL